MVLPVRRSGLLLVAVLASAAGGCGAVEVRGARVTDAELKASGQWSKRDALARALLDLEGAEGPVRLAPLRRKLLTELVVGGLTIPLPRFDGVLAGPGGGGLEAGFLEALLGLDYEKRYHYVAAVKGYVILNRERGATIASEDPGARVVLPRERTDPRAFRALREDLERDLERLLAPRPAPPELEVDPGLVIEP